MTPSDELLESAVVLRGQAPEAWARFMAALRIHMAMTTSEMTRCEPGLLQRAQGMAIATTELVTALGNAYELVERRRTNGKGQQKQQHQQSPY